MSMRVVSVAILVALSSQFVAAKAAENGSLTQAEKAAGWKLLFDGKTGESWHGDRSKDFPGDKWIIEDGCMKSKGGGDGAIDLVSNEEFGDFELTLEWKTAAKGNSGIIYRANESRDATWQTGPEFQILDDGGAGVEATDAHSAGAIYDLYPPSASKVLKPAGEFNQARIRIQHNRVEHWLNGVKVVEANLDSDDWKQRIAKSKFAAYEGFGALPKGHIVLQDHGDQVWFRNIKVRDLDAPMPGEISLFNGKNMDGWTFFLNDNGKMGDTWHVADGMIICSGNPAGYIRTERDFTNYVLKLEWQYPPGTNSNANSGVLLRMIEKDMVWPKSIEAQLMTGNAGDFFSIENFPIKSDPDRTRGRNIKKFHGGERPIGEWNEYEIIVDHGSITLNVNGDTLNKAWDVQEVPGKICLQSEGAEIHFRNVRIAPIP